MRVAITRPVEEARATAARLEAAGHRVLIEPALRVQLDPTAEIPARRYQAILVTSASAARSLAARADAQRFFPVLLHAVGASTAAKARELGFRHVVSANGAASDLAALAVRELDVAAGPLLYAAGRERTGGLEDLLRDAGYHVDVAEIYRAETISRLSEGFVRQLIAEEIDVIAFTSRRAAEAFLGAAG